MADVDRDDYLLSDAGRKLAKLHQQIADLRTQVDVLNRGLVSYQRIIGNIDEVRTKSNSKTPHHPSRSRSMSSLNNSSRTT